MHPRTPAVKQKDFALCGERQGHAPFEPRHLLKKVNENFQKTLLSRKPIYSITAAANCQPQNIIRFSFVSVVLCANILSLKAALQFSDVKMGRSGAPERKFVNNLILAFLFALFAGLSTGIGSALALLSNLRSPRTLSFTLGFSAGVMLYVSLTEILQKANAAMLPSGIALIALIGAFIPSFEGEAAEAALTGYKSFSRSRLWRCGIFSAFAIAIHNFPEGMATFISALRSPEVALPVVFAIAIHNVPEGIAVAAPVHRATGSKRLAFLISFLSGLAEPLGALFCWALLMPIMSDLLFGIVFAAAAGIMVYICLDEIIPAAEEGGHHAASLLGALLGMATMCASLLLF